MNAIIVEFIISNRDLIIAENKMGENTPEPSLGVYGRRRAKGEDIFSLIYSNCIIAQDLGREINHFEIAKNYIRR